MKHLKYLSNTAIATALLALPFASGFAIGVKEDNSAYSAAIRSLQEAQAKEGIAPQFAFGSCYDYYPLALENFAGFTSKLEVANVNDTPASFNICAVPAGTVEFTCRSNVVFGPRGAKFFDMPDISTLFKSTVGQLYVFANANSVGASQLFLFSSNGSVSVVIPYQFCP